MLFLLYRNKVSQPKQASAGRTVTVQRGKVVAKLVETGSIEPLSVVAIKSEQSGEVKRLFVQEGDRVKTGQRLVIIQQESGQARQAAQFHASLEEEWLNMDEAQRELERQHSLYEKGFVSLKDVEDTQKKYEKAKVRHDLAKRQLLLMLGGNKEILDQYLKRDLASAELDQFIISAPSSGTVIELGVQEGEKITSGTATVGGGTTLMVIADLSRMVVKSRINEVNIIDVEVGQPVEIRLDAITDKVYHGMVAGTAPKGEREDNVVTYEVIIGFKDPDQQVKPLMTANVDIITGIYEDVLYLPVEALAQEQGQDVVYVEKGDVRQVQPVRVLTRTETVAVISEGVNEDDRVVLPKKNR